MKRRYHIDSVLQSLFHPQRAEDAGLLGWGVVEVGEDEAVVAVVAVEGGDEVGESLIT